MNELPKMPERPTRPERPAEEKRAKRPLWVRILFVIGLCVVAALFIGPFLYVTFNPIFGAIWMAIMFFGPIAAFHYFVWGRWIGDTIRREVAEEEEAREALEQQQRLRNPTGDADWTD
jgi:hypothetical protein